MVELNTKHQETKIVREFVALEAIDDTKLLRILYRESLYLDGDLTKTTIHSYTRDYDYWKSSAIGAEIIGMIELDLQQADPSIPRNID